MSNGLQVQDRVFRPNIRGVVVSSVVAIGMLLVFGIAGVAGFLVLGSHVFSWGFSAIAAVGIAVCLWTMRSANRCFVALDDEGVTVGDRTGGRHVLYESVVECWSSDDGIAIRTESGIVRGEQICFVSAAEVTECVARIRERSERAKVRSADPR